MMPPPGLAGLDMIGKTFRLPVPTVGNPFRWQVIDHDEWQVIVMQTRIPAPAFGTHVVRQEVMVSAN